MEQSLTENSREMELIERELLEIEVFLCVFVLDYSDGCLLAESEWEPL